LSSISLATGHCRACAHDPVAFGARTCPICGVNNPNPSVVDRHVGRGSICGLVAGMLIGGICGYLGYDQGWAGGVAGAIVGSLLGLLLGVIGGFLTAAIAWFRGVR
jgi:hypothetical protein